MRGGGSAQLSSPKEGENILFNFERGEIRKCVIDIGLQSETADQVLGDVCDNVVMTDQDLSLVLHQS